MDRDIRGTHEFKEAERAVRDIHRPAEGSLSDIADLQLSPDATRLLITGTLAADLDEPGVTRICAVDIGSGAIEILTSGPNSDRSARMSPDGGTIAFLSDRDRLSDFQLLFMDARTRAVTAGPRVEGWIEYLEWSPDGRRMLLGVAGYGAELSSGQGAHRSDEHRNGPDWLPQVSGASDEPWRRVWVLEADVGALSRVSANGANIWEATWCGNDGLAVVASDDPAEGAWYAAELSLVDLATGSVSRLHKPSYQIAKPSASPSGDYLAFIESVASDRGFVTGDLWLCDLRDGTSRIVPADDVDVSYVEWRSDDLILVAGHRGLETVVLLVEVGPGSARELLCSTDATTSGDYATVVGLHRPEDFAFIREGFFDRPALAVVTGGTLCVAATIPADDPGSSAEAVRWHAPDGLAIEGWLLRPNGEQPYATILHVHDGPVFHWRPHWLGRAVATSMLLRRGYAVFLPNPRGSSGRGQDFAVRVIGDVGGADTADLLSGIDHLVGLGLADPARLGIMGLSYGGFMACWLPTQDARFKAAIAVGPATNHVSHHLSCNIPQFDRLFLQDHYTNLAGAYYARSPILQAHRSRTPTLLVCGDLDRCTPAEEAVQFHNALRENGVESVAVRYPHEGHGVRGMPATIDFAARCAMWFERHITPGDGSGD